MAGTEVNLGELTLLELAKRTLSDGKVLTVVDVLTKKNEWLLNAVWVPTNQVASHIGTRSIGLPAGSHRMINAGVSKEFAKTRQVVEGTAMLEAYSEIDAKLVALAKDKGKFRSQEDKLFLSGLGQTWAYTLLYGNTTVDPEQINGWATRMNALGTYVAGAGGSGGDTTSVFIIQWGEEACHMIYPDGTPHLGIEVEDKGKVTVLDTADSTKQYEAYRTHFEINYGFYCHDPRSMARLANIEYTGSANIFDASKMIDLLSEMNDDGDGSVGYVNNNVKAQMDKIALDKGNMMYRIGEEFGKPVTNFRNITIRRMQSIVNTETVVA